MLLKVGGCLLFWWLVVLVELMVLLVLVLVLVVVVVVVIVLVLVVVVQCWWVGATKFSESHDELFIR